MPTGATVSGMLTTSQLTPAQRSIRESIRMRAPELQRRAQHHHLEVPRVHESILRVPGRTLEPCLIRVVEVDDETRRAMGRRALVSMGLRAAGWCSHHHPA